MPISNNSRSDKITLIVFVVCVFNEIDSQPQLLG